MPLEATQTFVNASVHLTQKIGQLQILSKAFYRNPHEITPGALEKAFADLPKEVREILMREFIELIGKMYDSAILELNEHLQRYMEDLRDETDRQTN